MRCNKIAFINGKGGCGKTTSIFHVAGVLAHRGEKVLVIDFDKQRNTTDTFLTELDEHERKKKTIFDFMLGKAKIDAIVNKSLFRVRGNANPKYCGVDVLGADERLEDEKKLKNVDIKDRLNAFIEENEYTWVLVDMPPSNKTLNEICFAQIVDFVIVPFSSDLFSVSGYGDLMKTVNRARELNDNLNIIGIYLSRYMEGCAVDKYIKNELSKFGDIFLDVQIPLKADIREAIMFGRPISYYKVISPSRSAYERLVDVMEKRIANLT